MSLPTSYNGALNRLTVTTPSRKDQLLGFLNSRRLTRFLPYAFLCLVGLWTFIYMVPPEYRYQLHPPSSYPLYPDGPWTAGRVKLDAITSYDERAEAVRGTFIYAYEGYRRYALPSDELRPVRGNETNNFNGWGVTMIDSLDTMWLMGLTEYWNEALEYVHRLDFPTPQNKYVPFFETTIRYLGGLLSAYALSHDPLLLAKSDELGAKLLPAFETNKAGFPAFSVNTQTGQVRGGWTGGSLWAEIASCQMEYKYLAHLTGKAEYFQRADHVMDVMFDANLTMPGYFMSNWNALSGGTHNLQFSVGAFSDSALEYYLKQWIMTSKSEPRLLKMYLETMDTVIKKLVYVSPNRGLMYVTDTVNGRPSHTLEHLSCFFPGLVALGLREINETYLSGEERQAHKWIAEGLAHTCWVMYADTRTGLGPDEVTMRHITGARNDEGLWVKEMAAWREKGSVGIPPGLSMPPPVKQAPVQRPTAGGLVKAVDPEKDYTVKRGTYLLRPETLESIYIMWKTTGDEVWRERSWGIFKAIETYAKTEFGYATVQHVDRETPVHQDEMASFFLAETLKYIYLTMLDPSEDPMPLDRWALNTEAHPLPVFEWSQREIKDFGVVTADKGLVDSAFGPGRGKGRFKMEVEVETVKEDSLEGVEIVAPPLDSENVTLLDA